MKSVYFTIIVITVLVFSSNLFGQDDKKNTEPIKAEKTKWTIVVTDNLAPQRAENGDNKKADSTKTAKTEVKTVVEKPSSSVNLEKSFSPKKSDAGEVKNGAQNSDKIQSLKQTDDKKKKVEKTPQNETDSAAKKLSDWEKTWSLLAKFSTSFDTNLEHDPVGVKAFGFVPSITAGYQMRSSNQRLRFIYSFAAPRYTIDTDLNRFGNYFAASYRYSIGKWSFETDGEVSLKGTSEDRETNDQYILTETIGYRFDKKTRLNVYGAYRIRRFPTEDADRNAVNPMLGFKFARQLSKKIDWDFGYRFDENRAVNPRQNYTRSTYKTNLSVQLTKGDLIETELSFRPRRYKDRLVEVGNSEVLRRDKKWSFDILWKHNFTQRFGFEAGYLFEKQTSNDPDKLYRNHQLVFSFFYHWGNGDVIEP